MFQSNWIVWSHIKVVCVIYLSIPIMYLNVRTCLSGRLTLLLLLLFFSSLSKSYLLYKYDLLSIECLLFNYLITI